MLALRLLPSPSPHLHRLSFHPSKPFFSLLSSFSSLIQASHPNPHVVAYLINTFKLSETRAIAISNRWKNGVSTQKPLSVIKYFQKLGFSDIQIQSAVRVSPQILFSDIDKTLQPKLEFFQELGLAGNDLGDYIAKNAAVLTVSLDKKLVPCVKILRNLLPHDENNKDLIRVLRRCSRILGRDPGSILLGNINFLQSCGVVGSQLSMLLKRQPWIFSKTESYLRDLVTKVLAMGFSLNSGMLVHGLHTVSSVSNKSIRKKQDLFRSSGFSEEECMIMFRKAPVLLRTSEKKLKFGIEFFMTTMNANKSVLVHRPSCLMMSMTSRVIPRYKVMQILRSKKLLKKDPSFFQLLSLTEEEFLDKFISRFGDNVEELLVAYKGHLLGS